MENKNEPSGNSEQEVKYRFEFKNAQGVLGYVVLGIKERNNDLAIAAFESLFPNEVWRHFEIVKGEPQSMISLEQAFKFAEWKNKNRWFHFDPVKGKWSYTFEHGTAMSNAMYEKNYMKTTAELFELFKQENNELARD